MVALADRCRRALLSARPPALACRVAQGETRYCNSPKGDVTEILEKALALPVEARAALVDSLLESLDTEVDEAVEAEWVREVQRRAAELDSGAVVPIPWAEVRSRLHAAVRDDA